MTDAEQSPTMLDRMGGMSGLAAAGVPSLAFVIANAIAGLDAAVVVAITASIGLVVLRRLRRQPIQPAVSGLLGVAVASLIALYTGSAEGYFLPGIWMSVSLAVVFAASVAVRRPLVGVIWNALTSVGDRPVWHADRKTLHAFDIATLAFVGVFVARYLVQDWLYDAGSVGWLAFARIVMGYPLLAVALFVTWWAVRRARDRSATAAGPETIAA
ncbi:DUF3159 domain-containing protein [Mycolicibacterium hippocampi]|uniref:Membrane protein n=1 Tax=Mycolicibacterium hippocampi TaxID=659824 RepID=A0A7I9ZI41_9MYCO|nr:DUF3159 domain-containing protein [Mycolicibacterium hippocampi]GFH00347.1 membrane protein [Mycolicibacterium hippocampi]